MAKSPLNFSLFGNLAKRKDRATEWGRFVAGLPEREQEDLQRAFGNLSPQSQGKAPAWLNAFKQATPVERQGLNLLARAFGGSRLGILETLFNLIPGLRSQRIDAPNTSAPSVREVLKRNPLPGVGPRGEDTRMRPGGGGSFRPAKPSTGPPRAGGGSKPATGGGGFTTGPGQGGAGAASAPGQGGSGFTRPPVGPARGSGDDGDEPVFEIGPRERRPVGDGVYPQFPGYDQMPGLTREEWKEKQITGAKTTGADFAGQFGTVDMFYPKAPSSNVDRIGYDALDKTMYIQFHPTELENGKAKKRRTRGNSSGPIYAYYDCPEWFFQSLLNANSPGRWVWDKLRIRGTRHGHQKPYSLARESMTYNKSQQRFDVYVPRKATADGFAPREFRGLSGQTIRNTLPLTAPARGTPNRGQP